MSLILKTIKTFHKSQFVQLIELIKRYLFELFSSLHLYLLDEYNIYNMCLSGLQIINVFLLVSTTFNSSMTIHIMYQL